MDMQLWQLRQKVHSSWLVASASVGIVIGTALVPSVGHSFFSASAWFVVGLLLLALGFWRRAIYTIIFIVAAGLLIGLWRGSVLGSDLVVYERLVGKTVQLTGTVSDDPDTGKRGETVLRLTHLTAGKNTLPGKVWVSTEKTDDIKRGDIVVVSGRVSEGFGSFAGAMFKTDIVSVMRPEPGDMARQARDWFADKVRLGVEEPEASLGLGYLLGQRRALPPELEQALVVTGLTHVVVASGYNLTILVRLARRLFVRVSKYLAALSAGGMVVMFMAVTGASPSMSRAGLVAGLSLAAWYYGRRFHPLVLLPFAAAVTVLVDPTYVWGDLGWQLSFAAFAGVMILAPLMQRYFYGDREPGVIRQILGETISATIMTLPILIFAFGQYSNIAIFANLLVLPLVPLAMLLTFLGGLGALIFPGFATVICAPASWLLMYMTAVIEYFADIPWAQATLSIDAWVVWAAYVVIAAVCVYLSRVTKYSLRDSNIVE